MRHVFADLKTDIGANPTFDLDNRGKRGVVLDIAKPAGPRRAGQAGRDRRRLPDQHPAGVAAEARPGRGDAARGQPAAGLRRDHRLRPGRARTPTCPASTSPPSGPASGIGYMTAPKGDRALHAHSGMGDHCTSLATVSAILAALYERERTGEGRMVQTSLLATGVYLGGFGPGGAAEVRPGGLDPAARTADQRRRQPLPQERRWPLVRAQPARRLAATGQNFAGRRRPAGPDRRSRASPPARSGAPHARELVAELDAAFAEPALRRDRRAGSTRPTWSGRRSRPRPRWTPTRRSSPPGPSWRSRTARAGPTARRPPRPASRASTPPSVRASPRLGEHTREVLAEIGYSAGRDRGDVRGGRRGLAVPEQSDSTFSISVVNSEPVRRAPDAHLVGGLRASQDQRHQGVLLVLPVERCGPRRTG